MLGSILSIAAGLIKLIGSAIGWAHDRSEQQQGAELHQLADLQQAEKNNEQARQIETVDSALTDDQLDDKLRQ